MAKSKATFGGELYTLSSGNGDDETQFIITKWDSLGFEMLSQYAMPSPVICSCPAQHRDSCRHREMIPLMLDLMDTGKYYRYEDGAIFEFTDGKLTMVPKPFGTYQAKPEPAPIAIADLPRPAQAFAEPSPFRRRI